MASGNDADPFERYFRPRPAGPHGSEDSQGTDGLGIPRVEDSQPNGVIVDGARAPHVPVSPRRSHRRQDAGAAGTAGSGGSGGSGGASAADQASSTAAGTTGATGAAAATGAAGAVTAAARPGRFGRSRRSDGTGRHSLSDPESVGPGGSGTGSGSGSGSTAGPRSIGSARRQRRFLMITGAMSVFVLLSSGAGWAFQGYVLGQIEKIDPFKGLGKRPGGGPKGAMNILVAGVDRREGLTSEQIRRLRLGRFEGERSDTMMLVHVSRDHDKASVISLPRDSLVTIPSHRSNGAEGSKGSHIPARQGKLNWTYTYGGSTLMIDTIEKSTGVRIDHYVEVNFIGFIKMVEALGKVTVCTEQPVDDPKSGLRLPAGKSQLNGEQALAYARARYTLTGGSDLGRIDRQQQFMAALMQQALSTSTLTDPVKATRFLNAALDAVRVDKELAEDAPALVDQLKNISTNDVTFAKVPLTSQNSNVVLGGVQQSTVQWDNRAAYDLFSRINRDEPLVKPAPKPATTSPAPGKELTVAPGDMTVRVLNGHGKVGLAAEAAADLKKAGFATIVVPGVARTGLKTTQIQYGRGREDSARTLAAAIPGAKVKEVASLGDRIQVIVGSAWDGARKVKVKRPQGSAGTGDEQALEAKTATQQLCK